MSHDNRSPWDLADDALEQRILEKVRDMLAESWVSPCCGCEHPVISTPEPTETYHASGTTAQAPPDGPTGNGGHGVQNKPESGDPPSTSDSGLADGESDGNAADSMRDRPERRPLTTSANDRSVARAGASCPGCGHYFANHGSAGGCCGDIGDAYCGCPNTRGTVEVDSPVPEAGATSGETGGAMDPGPAKEAAPASFSTGTTPADVIDKSLRETATGAPFGGVDEAYRIASRYARGAEIDECYSAIRDLVKRGREAEAMAAKERVFAYAKWMREENARGGRIPLEVINAVEWACLKASDEKP